MRIGAFLAAGALVATVPVQAQCWGEAEQAAARVHQFQTMLMVTALRCHAAGIDITGDYGRFVTGQAGAITRANLVIKQHFAAAGGAQADYDRFATALANHYGTGATSPADCAESAALAHDAAAADAAGLEALASTRLFPAVLPGGACGAPTMATAAPTTRRARPATVTLALAAPPVQAAAPPILPLAPPPPERAPVTLPAEVTTALAVLARFDAARAASAAVDGTQVALAH